MSNNYGPRIVTDGLVLCLDAADRNSYPDSGTTWYDLSGNSNNGSLVNGVAYNSENKGSLVFDGTNDIVNGSNTILLENAVTISALIKHSAITIGQKRYVTVIGELAVIRQDYSRELHFYINTNAGIKALLFNNYLQANKWYYIVGTWDGAIMKLYSNSILLTSSSITGSLSGEASYMIGGVNGEYMNGNIAQVSIYNRALNSQEIQQNYNATKGRFGL